MDNNGNGFSETPADIFYNQFFTIFFVMYYAARNSLTRVPDAFTLKSKLSLYPVFHHKIINFTLGAKGIFFAVFCMQKALGIVFLKTHLLPQKFTFLPKITCLYSAFHLRVYVIASKNLMDLLFFSKYCRKAQIKKRKTRLIDLIKNQNYQ